MRPLRRSRRVTALQSCERRLIQHYDLEVSSRFIEIREPRMRIRVLEAGDGPPLLLVHGGGVFGAQWLPLFQHLTTSRLIAIDCPGRGLSDRFNYAGVDIRTYGVRMLASVLDALELEQATVVGNSLGGYWALSLALAAPERVAALILLGSPAFLLDNAAAPRAIRLLGMPVVGRLMFALSTPSNERRTWAKFAGKRAIQCLPDTFFEYSYREGRLPGSGKAFTSLFRRLSGIGGLRRELFIGEEEIRLVATPTLFIWGSEEIFGAPELAERAASLLPDARLEMITAGHVPWFDAPAACGRAIKTFVAEHTASDGKLGDP